jgi:hypothetical protein
VGVQAHQTGRDPEVPQEVTSTARIFSRHDRHLAEHPKGTERDVVEVADRRRDDEQRTGHILL